MEMGCGQALNAHRFKFIFDDHQRRTGVKRVHIACDEIQWCVELTKTNRGRIEIPTMNRVNNVKDDSRFVLPQSPFTKCQQYHSFIVESAFPLRNVARRALGLEISHGFQQSWTVLLAPHKMGPSQLGHVITPPGLGRPLDRFPLV